MSIKQQMDWVKATRPEIPLPQGEQPQDKEIDDGRGGKRMVKAHTRPMRPQEANTLEAGIMSILRAEVSRPEYTGMTAAQLAAALNEPVYAGEGADRQLVRPARVFELFRGVPFAPNAVDAADIEEARK